MTYVVFIHILQLGFREHPSSYWPFKQWRAGGISQAAGCFYASAQSVFIMCNGRRFFRHSSFTLQKPLLDWDGSLM